MRYTSFIRKYNIYRKHSKKFGYHTFSRIGAGIGLHVSTRSPEMIGLRVIAAADKPGRLTGWLTVRFLCLRPPVSFPAIR